MKIYTLKQEQLVASPVKDVFAFFERPENLELITPPSLHLTVLTPAPIQMREGALIDYTIRSLGLRFRWTSLITEYDPPFRFVDQQLRGPYSFWHHTHTFLETKKGTLVADEVRYVVPLGPLGRLLHAVHIERQLDSIFDFRRKVLEQQFPTA